MDDARVTAVSLGDRCACCRERTWERSAGQQQHAAVAQQRRQPAHNCVGLLTRCRCLLLGDRAGRLEAVRNRRTAVADAMRAEKCQLAARNPQSSRTVRMQHTIRHATPRHAAPRHAAPAHLITGGKARSTQGPSVCHTSLLCVGSRDGGVQNSEFAVPCMPSSSAGPTCTTAPRSALLSHAALQRRLPRSPPRRCSHPPAERGRGTRPRWLPPPALLHAPRAGRRRSAARHRRRTVLAGPAAGGRVDTRGWHCGARLWSAAGRATEHALPASNPPHLGHQQLPAALLHRLNGAAAQQRRAHSVQQGCVPRKPAD